MFAIQPFMPGASVKLSLTTSSGRVALPGTRTGAQRQSVRLYNSGAVDIAIAFGDSTITAANDGTSMIIKSGTVELFQADKAATHIAGIALSSTADLYITRGDGI